MFYTIVVKGQKGNVLGKDMYSVPIQAIPRVGNYIRVGYMYDYYKIDKVFLDYRFGAIYVEVSL